MSCGVLLASGTHSIPGALLAPIGSWRPPGPRRLATIVHDRAAVHRLLNSDSPPDILRSRLVYDSAGDRRASDAEGACAVDKTTPTQKTDSAMGLDRDEDADAVLAVDFEHVFVKIARIVALL